MRHAVAEVDHWGYRAAPMPHGLWSPAFTKAVASMSERSGHAQAVVGGTHMPSDVSLGIGFFDRFAGRSTSFASKPWLFGLCLLLVIIWVPSS